MTEGSKFARPVAILGSAILLVGLVGLLVYSQGGKVSEEQKQEAIDCSVSNLGQAWEDPGSTDDCQYEEKPRKASVYAAWGATSGLGILILVLGLLAPVKRTIPQQATQTLDPDGSQASVSRTCPYCAEEIKLEAVKCKHCHSILDPRMSENPEG